MNLYTELTPAEASGFMSRHPGVTDRMTAPYLIVRDGQRIVMLFKKTTGEILFIDVTGSPVPANFDETADPGIVGKILTWIDPNNYLTDLMYGYTQTKAYSLVEDIGNLLSAILRGGRNLAESPFSSLSLVVLILGGVWLITKGNK